MQAISYLLARFSEPSSYAGLGAVLALLGVHFSNSDLGQIAQFLAAGCGVAALLLKERGLIQMLALAVLAGATLSACTGVPTPAGVQSATQAILTTTEQVMCTAQAAANLAGAVAAAAGDATAASEASAASTAAGVGCTWANSPATGPAPAPATSA